MDVAVVVATYNQVEYVAEALESVLEQRYAPSHIVVTDDGSVDGTQDVAREYEREYPDIVTTALSETNRGIPQNFNEGLEKVSADAVTFLAGDDRYRPKKIEQEVAELKRQSDVGVAYSNFAYLEEDGTISEGWTDQTPPTGDVLVKVLTRDWPNTTLFRNPLVDFDLLADVGFFDESFPRYEDWDLKIRLCAKTNVAYTGEVLTEYRRHDDGVSKVTGFETHAELFERIWTKHQSLIKNLPASQRQRVEGYYEGQICRHRALAARQEGAFFRGLREYVSSLRANPERVHDYPDHLRFLVSYNRFRRLMKFKNR